jgi:adenylyl-sulfate kinase
MTTQHHNSNLASDLTASSAVSGTALQVPEALVTQKPESPTKLELGEAHRRGLAIFLTGLSGAGKTSIARELGARLRALGYEATLLDGDDLRSRVSPDLGFSRSDRQANLRRASIIASEVVKHGGIAICSFIAPYEQSRKELREMVEQHGRFFLVHVSTPLRECERRDSKGLYVKARAGLLTSFTGVSDIYEPPADCDTAIDTTGLTVHVSTDRIVRGLATKGLPPSLWLVAGLRIAQAAPSLEEGAHASLQGRNEERRAWLFHCVVRATAERRVTLTEVAREVGVERHTVERVVRSVIGQSFRELQKSLLCERANLLLEQGRAIKEIAFEVGFGSPQSFHRFIRRTYGTTPSCLRRSV